MKKTKNNVIFNEVSRKIKARDEYFMAHRKELKRYNDLEEMKNRAIFKAKEQIEMYYESGQLTVPYFMKDEFAEVSVDLVMNEGKEVLSIKIFEQLPIVLGKKIRKKQ